MKWRDRTRYYGGEPNNPEVIVVEKGIKTKLGERKQRLNKRTKSLRNWLWVVFTGVLVAVLAGYVLYKLGYV